MLERSGSGDFTSEIIGAAIEVHRALGPGLLESTYETCLAYKLEKIGFRVQRQVVLALRFEELVIPEAYRIDLLINSSVVVELKACSGLAPVHFAQVLSYLKASKLKVGLLINFNTALLCDGIQRVVNGF